MGDFDRPVQATPDVLADLARRFEDDLYSAGLADYAQSIGLTPPPEPAGYRGWAIVEAYPDYPADDWENRPVLYWNGPEDDHGEEDTEPPPTDTNAPTPG